MILIPFSLVIIYYFILQIHGGLWCLERAGRDIRLTANVRRFANLVFPSGIFVVDFSNWSIRYKQAAFCYEELILFQPTVPLYHLAYAEV